MSTPKDISLYEKVKRDIYVKYPKNSAYRSGLLVKEYKERYMKKYNSNDAYEGTKKKNVGLDRWFKEEWKNQRGEVGYDKKGDVYRPTKKITQKTPKTFKELSKKDIANAMKEKKKSGRVRGFRPPATTKE